MMTDTLVIRTLWILAALGVPIFGVSFGHFETGFVSVAPSVFFMGLILYVIMLRFFSGFRVIPKNIPLSSYKGLALLLAVFFVLHALALMHAAWGKSDWLDIWGTKGLIKLFFGVILFWTTIIYFPRDEKFIGRFFLVAGVALSCLLAVFIHKYAIVAHMPFLATDYYGFAKTGKNQAAVQSVFLFFYLFSFFLLSKKRFLILPSLMIILLSILYFQSRMGWAATLFGLIYFVASTWRCNPKMGRELLIKSSFIFLGMGILTLVFISQYIDLSTMFLRFFSIFMPQEVMEFQTTSLGGFSYQTRMNTISGALEGFYNSPVIGAGLGNTFNYIEKPTHNDFITLLVELGIPGEIVFLSILWSVWRRGRTSSVVGGSQEVKWLSIATRAGFVAFLFCLNFYNMYLSPYFWIYLALYIVTVETLNTNRIAVQTT